MEILNVENLTFSYSNSTSPVLNNISFSVNPGEFIVLCGSTGSGKSTLLKNLKKELAPLGKREGNIYIKGNKIAFDDEESSKQKDNDCFVGFVMQNPKEQIVTDKVWHELAFGLENMNVPQEKMALKVAEMASYFGIESWFDKNVNELSGGQMQLLNLASIMVMNPSILILDEPSAQLDPIAASEFFRILYKLNRDFALTVIIAEHRLEELLPLCDKLMLMEDGKITGFDEAFRVIGNIDIKDDVFEALPASYRMFRNISDANNNRFPLTIREGRDFLSDYCKAEKISDNIIGLKKINDDKKRAFRTDKEKETALEFKDICFRFDKDSADVLNDLSIKVYSGEVFCILGGNGSGKTTALNVAAGLLKPYSGTVKVFGKKIKEYKNQSLYNKCLSMMPQDVQTVFLHNTVYEELGKPKKSTDSDILKDFPFDVASLFDKHPYDLSGGEQQILALAKAYMTEPKLLLMDEPTKGLDVKRKKTFVKLLKTMKERGITCIIVTHDVELAAECADRCALFFRGNSVSCSDPYNFFTDNNFYTTSAVRLTKDICGPYITVENTINGLKSAN